jgi:putative DNA primase/helicase
VSRTLDAAAGRWPELLQALGGLTDADLCDREGPCPSCAVLTGDAGNTRFKWDDDSGNGGWFCSHCGGKDRQGGGGTGVDLLMRVTGWDLKQALRQVEQHLGIATAAPIPAPPTDGAEQFWRYAEDFYVARFPGKKIRPLWWDGTAWRWKAPPSPRPLYWARRRADAEVLIAEGEKAADAAATLFQDHAVCTWPSGCKAIGKADWSPLRGRTCLLWPDADTVGREAMAKLAQQLIAIGCTVRIVAPPDTVPAGWDLADAAAEGWTPQRAAKAVERYAKTVEAPPAPPAPPPGRPLPEVADIPSNAPFTCLGFDDQNYYYQPSTTGQITRLRTGNHTETHLLMLHPDTNYWQSLYPTKTGVDWSAAKAALFAAQHRVGIFNADRIRGRGACWDEGRAVLHLGDRLIVDGQTYSVMQPPPSRFSYQRLVAIDVPDTEPLSDHEGWQLVDLASRFHWEVPASGLLLAGWTALAPICGALSWRPHAWLTASAGSGKSILLERFVQPLLGEMALWPQGVTTEASIRQDLRTDLRPVVFDEAEPNEQSDKLRIQAVLSLARVASSESRYGYIGKGGADGVAQRFKIRSMFLLCSISTALKQGADLRRFAQLTMRNPAHLPEDVRTAHWDSLDADLTRLVTDETGHRLLARSVRMIPTIRESVAVFRRAAAKRFDSQAAGDQFGTLLAGAWSLSNTRIATLEDAYDLIDNNNWEQYRQDAEQPDERRCLDHLLQHQLRVEGDRGNGYMRTIYELVELSQGAATSMEIGQGAAEAHLGRIGVRVVGDRVVISNTAQGIRRMLDGTAWANSWGTVLTRLPGARREGATRFRGLAGNSRAVSVPIPER